MLLLVLVYAYANILHLFVCANKTQLIFKKYCTRQKSIHARNHLHTHAPTWQAANGSGTAAGLRRLPSRPDATREARRDGRRPSPSTFSAHLDTQAPKHQPTRTHHGPPTRIFPAPPAPVRGAGSVAWRRVFRAKDTFPVPFIA